MPFARACSARRESLRAATTTFLATSVPKILAQAGTFQLSGAGHRSDGPVTADALHEAQELLSLKVPFLVRECGALMPRTIVRVRPRSPSRAPVPVARLIGARHRARRPSSYMLARARSRRARVPRPSAECTAQDPLVTFYFVNSKTGANRFGDMTEARVNAYMDACAGAVDLSRRATTAAQLDKVIEQFSSCNRVVMRLVDSVAEMNPFLYRLHTLDGIISPIDESDREPFAYNSYECDCEVFARSGNDCPHTLCVCCARDDIDIDKLLTNLGGTRRAVGRPRKHDGGCLVRDKQSREQRHSAAWFERQIAKHKPLHFHKWRIVRRFGGEHEYVGFMTVYKPGSKAKSGAKKSEDMWTIYYEHDQQCEEINLPAFAAGLALAHERGCAGPAPMPPQRAQQPAEREQPQPRAPRRQLSPTSQPSSQPSSPPSSPPRRARRRE